ncbi:unnamed protein product [Penicillium salamii]|uniref:Uncharacterized protein n=1 Tax=Penicillium salamii TaxID=1612424 RepID=A0A9W4NKD7_9EURO|nr:unnamed protein product [Penicillium salamii]CAG8373029.1 unnamed protein product [Penicillium salamii]CAG8377880.1 unnamed protein product [Penicillium salamii]CAG8392179.1 unnamed protein product [Penicillium salamii]
MNSWLGSNHADEQPVNHYPGWSIAASPSNQPSPSRREHAVQPPLLTTALSGSQYQGLGAGLGLTPTPLSSTSLSSPFTHGQSPCVPTPTNGRSVSSSSMASRNAYNVPYNPQDWGPPGRSQAQGYAPPAPMHRTQRNDPDASLSPPPPPYSPPNNPNRMTQTFPGQGSSNFMETPSPPNHRESEYDMPAQYQRRSNRPRPLSMVYSSDSGSHHQSLPPPPPPQGPANRSVSQSRVEYQGTPYGDQTANYNTPPSHRLRPHQAQIQSGFPQTPAHLETPSRPPASRRAASAGAVVSSAGSSRAASQSRNRSPSNSNWEPGMPLPPPPPGPPPTTRSVSVSGSSESSMRTPQGSSTHDSGRTSRRAPPVLGTGLGSIPPTPADWIDEAYLNNRPTEELYVDTAKAAKHTESTDPHDPSHQKTPGSGGLFRSSAVRDPSAKGIRERRIERRNRQSQVFEPPSAISQNGNPWADALEQIKPSNLILPEQSSSPDQIRHPSSAKYTPTPRSTRSVASEGQPAPSRSRASSGGLFSEQSPYGTPKQQPSSAGPSAAFAHTPPFSPGGVGSAGYPKEASQAVPPKALPTPPLNSAKDARPRSRAPSRGAESRPISHILHMPNDTVSMMKPLSPRRTPSQSPQASMESVMRQDSTFLQDAVQRHKAFVEKEASAADETEALKTFADYILAEAQIRRQRYSKAWDSFQVEDVRRNLFELPVTKTGPGLPKLDIPQNRANRPETAWWNNYQPCLSPIASLNMSNDEMSSRGRAPSRWWESKTGSSSDGAGRRVQRSKRESKYMGLPPLQWDQELTPQQDVSMNYGPHEYPPEKVGWHEDSPANSTGTGYRYPGSRSLDISRLITMPPPYPRHHPAVNNSHPDLVTHRTTVRSITDLTEVKTTRHRYKSDMERMLQEHQQQIDEGRRHFKANIQSQIQEGSLTFAEAAEAEAAMIVEENELERQMIKRQLDTYQEIVLKPMNAILVDRISRATSCIDELSSILSDDAQRGTPDETQEEGDEKPELLEKLTQLKWLFEAREQLHRESFDLVSDRDDKYKAVALLPYKQTKNEDKLRETQAFFSQDALDRRVQFENEALTRLESFLYVIEQNVVRGVEVQLSAFWDIAPSLLALVQQVPENLQGFQVQIPSDEYDENPSYHAHPLQYLYTLLSHAEKSSYQFIESQTNLLCLLHEVRSAVMRANRVLVEAERIKCGETEENVRREMMETRADEELALTTDLKEKVATVEGQWTEALGSQIEELRERVKEQLVREDGWEDLEQLEE